MLQLEVILMEIIIPKRIRSKITLAKMMKTGTFIRIFKWMVSRKMRRTIRKHFMKSKSRFLNLIKTLAS